MDPKATHRIHRHWRTLGLSGDAQSGRRNPSCSAPPRRLPGARATVRVFMWNRCPGVKAYDARLRRLHDAYVGRGVRMVGVNPVDERNYPEEDLEGMAAARAERSLAFDYVKDEGQR